MLYNGQQYREFHMKVRFLMLVGFFFSTAHLICLPRVAVLDAVLPGNTERGVAIGITEKISEELVSSGQFMVLDRTTVDQSLKEIEFQVSGLVSDAEIMKAGAQLSSRLGAAYVVVARVSLVSGTYFVSAKMVDVKTGEITAQASDEERGNASVTLSIAQRVGSKLAGKLAARPAEESGREAADMSGFTPIGPELLPNPSFDRGRANWEFWVNAPAAGATFSVTLRSSEFDSAPAGAKVSCSKPGRIFADVQLWTGPSVIRKNSWYRLSFRAKATVGFQIQHVKFLAQRGAPDYFSAILNDAPIITTTWETHAVYFCASTDASDVRTNFDWGDTLPAGATFYIDSLSLKECIQNP
jgi:TolB-like protein